MRLRTVIGRLVPGVVKRPIRRLVAAISFARREQVADLEASIGQLATLLRTECDVAPPPPKHLQVRVVAGYRPGFLESGYRMVGCLDSALREAGKELTDFNSILDFGCGCGRVTRAMRKLLPTCDLHGTDIDEEAIGWLKENYGRFAHFTVAPHRPPTSYGDGQFDLIVGISVFTHLPEDLQVLWLQELRRVSRPGGYILLTTHGEHFYPVLDARALRGLKERGFYYTDFGSNYGQSIALPDFYQTAFHTHPYIRRQWGRFFDVVDIRTRGLDGRQDVVLLQRRCQEMGNAGLRRGAVEGFRAQKWR